MKNPILQRLFTSLKAEEMKPKKLKIVQHAINGSMYLEGRKILYVEYVALKTDDSIKLVEIGKPNNKRNETD